MPQFHEFTVTEVRKTIRDAVVLTLRPDKLPDFEFVQGQYLTFRKSFDGVEVRRCYSICSGIDEGIVKVGIKKVEGGAFSTWANDELEPGTVLEAMSPMGSFHCPLTPDIPKHYLGFAGGSGITPVLSILKTVLFREPRTRFTLVYANRSVGSIMFREELEDLKNNYMERFSMFHVLESGAQNVELFQGRIDSKKCSALLESLVRIDRVETTFLCGPQPMMLGIASALKSHGVPDSRIKFELFKSDQPGRVRQRQAGVSEAVSASRKVHVTATIDGTVHSFELNRGMPLLEGMIENSLDPPFACKAGVCSTCKCKLLDGEVEMTANHALEDYEVERGYILACQSHALTDRIAVQFES